MTDGDVPSWYQNQEYEIVVNPDVYTHTNKPSYKKQTTIKQMYYIIEDHITFQILFMY